MGGFSACSPSDVGLADAGPNATGGAGGGKVGGAGGRTPDPVTCANAAKPAQLKGMGQACMCSNECASGQCVDGVCCSSACGQTCYACNVPGKLGTCSPVAEGQPPADKSQCKTDPVSTCGSSGLCDGAGKCAKYAEGTVCQPGTCDGGDVVGAKQCTAGKCEAGERIICAPFACNATAGVCFNKCDGNAQCVSGKTCDKAKCGKAPLGASCEMADDCESGFCADKVCCNRACNGMCEACNQVGKMGECSPVPAGNADLHMICKDDGKASCGYSGVCDGKGGCAKYAAGTICKEASCSGGMLLPASVCDGTGSCSGGSAIACKPYACKGNSCVSPCVKDDDCQAPAVCQGGSCGPKPDGVKCAAGSECQSKNCVDGVCCNEACNGLCRYCNSPQAPGKCVNVANNAADPRAAAGITDPARACLDQGPNSCGRNGLCNGNAGCQLYATGTMCKAASCDPTKNTAYRDSTCDGGGKCVQPPGLSCSPYVCNGTSRCFTTCSSNMQCSGSNTCMGGSCGLLPNGASCSAGPAGCASGVCAQGVCCATACNGSCFSCALPGSPGQCKAVPAGSVDPTGTCKDQGSSSCGNDGTCNGSGGCRKYAAGTVCVAASCSMGTASAKAVCDGSGTCKAGGTTACSPYVCNPAGTDCYSSCADNGACAPPNTCNMSSCGKKNDGAKCSANAECVHNNCVDVGNGDKVCCATACAGTCMTCATGACKAVANGVVDPLGRCMPDAAGCGNDGFCNGAGACRLQPATKTCGAQSCPAGMNAGTFAPMCDGKGKCSPAVAFSCGTFKCDPTANDCFKSCTLGANPPECVAGNACTQINGQQTCGLKDNGVGCAGGYECKSGKCIDGVCCNLAGAATSCGPCKSCKGTGPAGTCSMIANGMADATCMGANTGCGVTNVCQNGACSFPSGTSCGFACSGDLRVTQTCNGSGGCTTPMGATPTACPNNAKCTGGGCPDTCAADSDCLAGFACEMPPLMSAAKTCRKLNQGEACGTHAATTCGTGTCADGVCCDTACTGSCRACNITGKVGTCSSVDGPRAADDTCAANPQCGSLGCTMGTCEMGTCSGSSCGADGVSTMGQTCSAGSCVAAASTPCPAGYKCNSATGSCFGTCTTDAQCASGYYCNTTTSACVAKKATGTCNAPNECSTGFCTGGFCCGAAACPATCTMAGDAVVQQTCASGACAPMATSMSCGGFVCAAGACKQTCASPSDCVSGYTCSGGTCVVQKANGQTCGAGAECVSGNCVGTTCCATACPTSPPACSADGLGVITAYSCPSGTGCAAATTSSCSPYRCAGGSCKATCTVLTEATDCAPGFVCDVVTNPLTPACVAASPPPPPGM